MAVAGLASGTFLRFIFTNACVVESGVSVGAGNAPFYLRRSTSDTVWESINFGGTPSFTKWRFGAIYLADELAISPCFLLVEGPNT